MIYEDRPDACRDFIGQGMYRYECSNEFYLNSKGDDLS